MKQGIKKYEVIVALIIIANVLIFSSLSRRFESYVSNQIATQQLQEDTE